MTFTAVRTFIMAAVACTALMVNATAEASHPLRFTVVLLALNVLHLVQVSRLWVTREFIFYLLFIAYMAFSLLWTSNLELGASTVGMAVNFFLILVLFGALFIYYPLGAAIMGTLAGFAVGALNYTLTTGFPFVYPEGFSYNSIAGMYLFGLFLTLLFGWHTRTKLLPLLIGAALMLHILATTSIKTNLGIVLGLLAATFVYFRASLRIIVRGAIPAIVLGGAGAYAVMSNPALMERLDVGFTRVGMGVALLTAREDVNDNIGLGTRADWKNEGLKGWVANPVFGHGVEGFRIDFGITSHSTPVDLLYNSGLIGSGLFAAMFISMAWRLYNARDRSLRSPRAILIAALVCYLFMLLSAAMYFDTFLAGFVAIGTAVICRASKQAELAAEEREADEMGWPHGGPAPLPGS